ncbi:MAG TPA: hypothetical protein VH913_01175 [Hyphomicrobiaceae bacterium]|jgi:hypothetical protein
MSRGRLIVAGLTAAALAALIGWQVHRERLVKACLDGGGEWYGRRSICRPPLHPILQRDFQRS